MTIRIDDLDHVPGGGARRSIVRSTIALGLATAAFLAAPASSAGASAPELGGAWSSGFDDSLWTITGLAHPKTLSPLAGWAGQCLVDCGPAFGTSLVRRGELMSSNTADVSVNRVADSTGHMMGVSGMIVVERLETDSLGAGALADWVVVGERAVDTNGTHSWALLAPDVSPDAHWLPIELYRFEDASFSMDVATTASADAGAAPEASTWTMTLIGLVALGVAGWRRPRNDRRSIDSPEEINA